MNKLFEKLKQINNVELSYKKWITLTITISLGIVVGAALLAFIVDPLYRYRKPFFYDIVYYELYATAPFFLRNYDYDHLMLGSSMCRNFFIDDINKTLECNSFKLAAAGCSAEDLTVFMDIADKTKGNKLKRITLSLDIYPLNKIKDYYKDFDYMYRRDIKEEYKYLFSRQTFSSMFFILKRKLRPKGRRKYQTTKNRMWSTDYEGKKYGTKEVNYYAAVDSMKHDTQTKYNKEAFYYNFYQKLLPFIDNNPNISFTIYLPPYHIYAYCLSEEYNEADDLIKQRTIVLKELLKRKNVELHDFQADRKYVLTDDYFCDVQHFSYICARKILKDLKADTRKLYTNKDIDSNEQDLRKLIKESMPKYYNDINQYKFKKKD